MAAPAALGWISLALIVASTLIAAADLALTRLSRPGRRTGAVFAAAGTAFCLSFLATVWVSHPTTAFQPGDPDRHAAALTPGSCPDPFPVRLHRSRGDP